MGEGEKAPRDVEAALAIARGTARLLTDMGFSSLTEVPLANGRRADLCAIDGAGHIAIVEVKSSLADFRADQKWPDYLDFCETFYFAVAPDFPREVIPDDCGLILADRYGAAVLRPSPARAMAAARRKAVTLRFGLLAAERLRRLTDPGP